mmetsp:Transcript_3535/g.3967  ORF Transcript_3535/g.3967 Transcript_3535/m.3967 type:complete len:81 (-) Transcript_3535:301-543(-)
MGQFDSRKPVMENLFIDDINSIALVGSLYRTKVGTFPHDSKCGVRCPTRAIRNASDSLVVFCLNRSSNTSYQTCTSATYP